MAQCLGRFAVPQGIAWSLLGQKRRLWCWVGAALIASLPACTPHAGAGVSETQAPEEAAPHEDKPAHEALPRRVRLSEQVIADAKIATTPVRRERLSAVVSLPGEVAADPDRLARVVAPTEGRLEKVSFKEGQTVSRGDVLAVVRVPQLGKVRGALASATARAKAARSNAERLKALQTQTLASAQEVEDAAAEATALDADVRALSAELAAMGTGGGAGASLSLRAPIAGVVVSRDAVLGQAVTSDTSLATIADLTSVWFVARVFEKDLGLLHPGASVDVQLNAYPDARFVGALEYVGRQVDPVARSITARIVLAAPDDRLRLGLYGRAHVATTEGEGRPPTLLVPRSAVTEIAGKMVVFVRHPDNDFELHEVSLGESASGKVEVLSGLREGEDVVSDGVFSLKSIVLKSAFAEDEE